MASTSPPPALPSGSGYHTSLLTAQDCRSHVHLIIGANPLAGTRCSQSMAAGAVPILVAPEPPAEQPLHYGLQRRIDAGVVIWHRRAFADDDLLNLGRAEVRGVVDAVFITTPPRQVEEEAPRAGTGTGTAATAHHISALCRRNRIPVNVVDAPHLCTFTLLATHTDGPLQIGITTNGRGCRLAGRIRREVAAALPRDLGAACARLGEMRRRVQAEDGVLSHSSPSSDGATGAGLAISSMMADEGDSVGVGVGVGVGGDEGADQSASFNRLVTDEALDAAKSRRIRWLSQVCEYWPLKRLAAISDEDVEAVLRSYNQDHTKLSEIGMSPSLLGGETKNNGGDDDDRTVGPAAPARRLGRVILAGSGPGHPDLLTQATLKAIRAADVVLADKLVPAGVLDLVPRRTPVTIARKFPGNADRAQEELTEAALAGVRAGKTVLRLKQGDPFVYGRGGEEVAAFRAAGLDGGRIVVLPGVTSALSAPLFAGIPPTQRDVADQVLVCTGTGKKGKAPAPPEYVASRTVVFLMALHRIVGLVRELTTYVEDEGDGQEEQKSPGSVGATKANGYDATEQDVPSGGGPRADKCEGEEGKGEVKRQGNGTAGARRRLWPRDTPCAVIERASCPDQRVIRTTLGLVAEAIEQEGSRPPGLLVVGRACEALNAPRPGRPWVVEDGFKGLDLDLDLDLGLDGLVPGAADDVSRGDLERGL